MHSLTYCSLAITRLISDLGLKIIQPRATYPHSTNDPLIGWRTVTEGTGHRSDSKSKRSLSSRSFTHWVSHWQWLSESLISETSPKPLIDPSRSQWLTSDWHWAESISHPTNSWLNQFNVLLWNWEWESHSLSESGWLIHTRLVSHSVTSRSYFLVTWYLEVRS